MERSQLSSINSLQVVKATTSWRNRMYYQIGSGSRLAPELDLQKRLEDEEVMCSSYRCI